MSDPCSSSSDSSCFRGLFPSNIYGDRPVVILDGGQGTTLQGEPFNLALDSLLWSSELLQSDHGRETLSKLHRLFSGNGAEIVGSCTYQSSIPMFLPASRQEYSAEDVDLARNTMNAALPIATTSQSPAPTASHFLKRASTRSALCLGPLGAQLSPGQEYGGLYPMPFGPTSPSQFAYSPAATSAHPLPALNPSNVTDDPFEDSLTQFHLGRLQDLAQSESFDLLSMYAFETVPLLREIRAIRRAVALFESNRAERQRKPFYISLVFPSDSSTGEPRFPDVDCRSDSMALVMDRIVDAMFGSLSSATTTAATAMPGGMGINCTAPRHLPSLIAHLTASLSRTTHQPWLVLYPDGGAVYDMISRSWSSPEGMNDCDWAKQVTGSVELARVAGCFEGVIAGACCKGGPESIRKLRVRCEERGWMRSALRTE